MEFGKKFSREAPLGGTEVTDVDVQSFNKSELKNMGINDLPAGVYGVGRNDEGFVIRLVKLELNHYEEENLYKYIGVMKVDVMDSFGVKH